MGGWKNLLTPPVLFPVMLVAAMPLYLTLRTPG
jgi:hypothetical protein